MTWEVVIGLEVHVQLATNSKIFSGASTAYGAAVNSQACAVDLGLPGVLPVINAQAMEFAVKFGIAVNAEIAQTSVFARKNYFYPDLPKGYQISQYEQPIVGRGELEIECSDGTKKVIEITRAHLEEDAGKSVHGASPGMTGIDLNRAGTPLLEIVTEPVMRNAGEAVAYLRELHRLVRGIGICDGNMQEGSFRCDANVSVRREGSTELGTRTETKNLNSFRFVERAIDYEVERQIELLESGQSVVQETRLYDADADETRSMRSKEDAHDYRYFPDPDLLPIAVTGATRERIRSAMPELPAARQQRYVDEFGLAVDDARTISSDPDMVSFFEQMLSSYAGNPKLAANWLITELVGALNKEDLQILNSPVSPQQLAKLARRIHDNTISGKIGKQIFQSLWTNPDADDPDEIIEQQGLKQVTDTGAIEAAVDQVIADNPDQVQQLKDGKDKVLGFLVGQVMKLTKGKANPKLANELMRKKINS